ncbi:MAG: GNAT family N-acetyltransferase [Lachnospiraceae bacterium]|nr:GNAT family N-acetyltransferase [Lachnospiraceae bacterium]
MTVEMIKTGTTQEDTYTAETREIRADGETVGYIDLMIDDSFTYCDCISIYARFQNRGIGTEVLRTVSAEFGGLVLAPDNEGARRLYARLGDIWDGYEAGYIDQGYGVYRV